MSRSAIVDPPARAELPPIGALLAQVKAANRAGLEAERRRRIVALDLELIKAQAASNDAEADVRRAGIRGDESIAAQDRLMTIRRRLDQLESGDHARGLLVKAAIDRHGRGRLMAGLMAYLRNRCPSAVKLEVAHARLDVNRRRLAGGDRYIGDRDAWARQQAEDEARIPELEARLPGEQRSQAEAVLRPAEAGSPGAVEALTIACRQGVDGGAPLAIELKTYDVASMRLLGALLDRHEFPDT
jgi:hypothetical protein